MAAWGLITLVTAGGACGACMALFEAERGPLGLITFLCGANVFVFILVETYPG